MQKLLLLKLALGQESATLLGNFDVHGCENLGNLCLFQLIPYYTTLIIKRHFYTNTVCTVDNHTTVQKLGNFLLKTTDEGHSF